MRKIYELSHKAMLFLHPIEIFKKIIKIILVSKEIFFHRISYYPKSVTAFENNFALYIGKKFGLTFCNGTSSIEAALFALGVGEGDEVLVPSCTFHASIDPIVNLGATPVFVDVKVNSFIISLDDLVDKITKKTKCIIVVHPFGYVADMEKILKISKEYNLVLLEDVSHAHGAKFAQRMAGSYGHISCFSLQGAKAIAAGEGGVAVTDDKDLYSRMSMYGHFNRHSDLFTAEYKQYIHTGVGHKLRAHPSGIVMAGVDLRFNDYHNNRIRKNDQYIKAIFSGVKGVDVFSTISGSQSGGFFGGIPLLVNPKVHTIEYVMSCFKEFGLHTSRYPWPCHHKLARYGKLSADLLPNTEFLQANLILIDRRLSFFLPLVQKYAFKKLRDKLNSSL